MATICLRVFEVFVSLSNRPEFCDLEKWFESLLLHIEVGLPLPSDMKFTLLPATLMRKISESNERSEKT